MAPVERKACAVCHENLRRGWRCHRCKARAIHFFCIWEWMKRPGHAQPTCPLCRAAIPASDIERVALKMARKTEKQSA